MHAPGSHETGISTGLTVWLVTDGKPGHKNQLKGLADRLNAHSPVQHHWIDAHQTDKNWLRGLLKQPLKDAPHGKPDLVIGAGHRTHALVVRIKRAYKAYSVVLMKPTAPLNWFDAAIIPSHDCPAGKRSVLQTSGVINTITPQTHKPDSHHGLFLIGGESQHFHWDSQAILDQVSAICTENADIQWVLTNSRRTPNEFWERLHSRPIDNLTAIHHQDTPDGWVGQQLSKARVAWVTPDSVSMVYEGATALGAVGLLNLTEVKHGRIQRGLQQLREQQYAYTFDNRNAEPTTPETDTLWEADRSAQWLLQQYQRYRNDAR